MTRRTFLTSLVLMLTAAGAMAQSAGGITVEEIWARATPPGAKTGAVYLTLANKGTDDDKLVGVSTPIAAMAGLHTEIMANGVMEMRPVKSVDVPPGGKAVLKPGARHIMLMELKQPLKQGGHFPLTLRFAHAAPMTVQVEIAKVGTAAPPMGDMDMKGMTH
jgi:hypothetical protein